MSSRKSSTKLGNKLLSMKRREAEQAGMEWRENFRPHAIILTERTRPEPIFVAAIIGAERLLRVDFDLDGERESYVKKSLKGVERRLAKWNGTIPAFGRPTGLIVNYAPNFAVRFDLRGTPQEMRADDVSETLERHWRHHAATAPRAIMTTRCRMLRFQTRLR